MSAKAKELRALSISELDEKLNEAKKELLKLNAQVAVGTTIKSPTQIKTLKRTIAKIITIKKEKLNK